MVTYEYASSMQSFDITFKDHMNAGRCQSLLSHRGCHLRRKGIGKGEKRPAVGRRRWPANGRARNSYVIADIAQPVRTDGGMFCRCTRQPRLPVGQPTRRRRRYLQYRSGVFWRGFSGCGGDCRFGRCVCRLFTLLKDGKILTLVNLLTVVFSNKVSIE